MAASGPHCADTSLQQIETDKFYRYVSKSKKLPSIIEKLKNTEGGRKALDQLIIAIKQADYTNSIYQHPNCLLMVQTLFEQGKISAEQRLSNFLYLSALQSHTTWQDLAESERHLKEILDVNFITSNNPDFLTLLDDYLNDTFGNKKIQLTNGLSSVREPKGAALQPISSERVKARLAALPLSEQSILTISIPLHYNFKDITNIGKMAVYLDTERRKDKNNIAGQLLLMSNESPLLRLLVKRRVFAIPSSGLFNILLNEVNPEVPIVSMPVLGRIKTETMFNDFTVHDQRMINIYCKDIISNLANAHEEFFGPLNVLLHDLVHAHSTVFELTKNIYDFYKLELIPFLLLLKKELKDHEFGIVSNILETICDMVHMRNSDLFSGLTQYYPKTDPNNPSDEPIGLIKSPILGNLFVILFLVSESYNIRHYSYPILQAYLDYSARANETEHDNEGDIQEKETPEFPDEFRIIQSIIGEKPLCSWQPSEIKELVQLTKESGISMQKFIDDLRNSTLAIPQQRMMLLSASSNSSITSEPFDDMSQPSKRARLN